MKSFSSLNQQNFDFDEGQGQLRGQTFIKSGIIDPSKQKEEMIQKSQQIYKPELPKFLVEEMQAQQQKRTESSNIHSNIQKKPKNQNTNIEKFSQKLKQQRQKEDIRKYGGKKPSELLNEKYNRNEDKLRKQNADYEQVDVIIDSISKKLTHEFVESNMPYIFIPNLPITVDETVIQANLKEYGEITQIQIVQSQQGIQKYTAYLQFASNQAATNALIKGAQKLFKGSKYKIYRGAKQNQTKQRLDEYYENEQDPNYKKIERIYAKPPDSIFKRKIIDKLAKYVAQDGHIIEKHIMTKERENSDFSFFIKTCDDHIYYRWRVFAYAQGDNEKS